ncbi:MAG: MYXO-CTERM sorting domain-containing protein [Polyangiaceae bacterium]
MRVTFEIPVLASALIAGTFASLYDESDARANGRFPLAQAVVTAPGESPPRRVVLRTTFGLVVSEDGGSSFAWACEEALGFSGTWDPPIALGSSRDVAPGGASTLFVGLPTGLRRGPGPCSLEPVKALDGEVVVDLATTRDGARVFGITATPTKPGVVVASKGTSFERLARGPSDVRFETIEVAPSRQERVYVTGTHDGEGPRGRFYRSDDGGRTLTETRPKLALDGPLFVSSVDPKDPDRVLVRQLHRQGSELLLTKDGGKTFETVLHVDGSMTGFALSDDGKTAWAGSGNPKEGLHRSDDGGATWTRVLDVPVLCLHAVGPKLFVCSNHFLPGGHALLVSDDGGKTARPILDFADVKGPVSCDGGPAASCSTKWPELRTTLVPRPAPPAADASVADGSVGAVGYDDGGAPPDAAPGSRAPERASTSRCSCRAIPENSAEMPWFALAVAAAVGGIRRRKPGSS